MYAMANANIDFGNWIVREIGERNMSQADLARLAGVTRTAISDVVNGRRNPGSDLAQGIAKAFSIPPEEVFRIAGLLPPKPGLDDEVERIVHEVSSMSDQDKAEVLAYIRMKKNIRKKKRAK